MAQPKYKNPPIDEALCEVAFDTQGQDGWDLTIPGKLQQKVADDYPGKPKTQNLQTIEPGGDPSKPAISLRNELFRIHLPNKDETRLLALGPNTLSVSIFKPYQSWEEDFRPRIDKALAAYMEVAEKTVCVRIGIRYINGIVIPEKEVSFGDYFSGLRDRDEKMSAQLRHFTHRSEYVKETGEKVVITLATIQAAEQDCCAVVLDIDAIWDASPIEGKDDILAQAESLHALEGVAFESIITDKTRALFS
ncbi:MAG: TIGR04255 family protein [Hyphomicrobium sp.]